MPIQDAPLTLKPYTSPFSSLGAEVVNNFYVEISTSDTAKSKYYYVGIPGLRLLKQSSSTQFSSSSACRGLYTTTGGKTYGVFGKNVVEVRSNSSYSLIGLLKTSSGIVRFCDNGDTVLLVDGSYGYTIETASNTLYPVTDESFPGIEDVSKGATHCTCVDGYFIVNSKGTRYYYWSAPNYVPYAFDSTKPGVETHWNGLDFGEKMGDSDNIVGIISTVDLIWVMGEESIEVHRNRGLGDDASGNIFGRMDNALVNFGVSAPGSICKFANSIYFIGQDKSGTVGIFTVDTGFQPKRISTRGVESRIQKYSKISDCYATVHSFNGHAFIVFNFPSGTPTDDQSEATGATWVYDIITDTWTRRTHWDADSNLSYMWKGTFCTYNFGKVIFGDASSNGLYWLDSDYYQNDLIDGSGVSLIQRIVTSPVQYMAGKNVVYRVCQLNMQQGQGLANPNQYGIGEDPQVGMSYSNDSGNTWSDERQQAIGEIGYYGCRTRWVSCGTGRNRVWKFRVTAPVFVAIIGMTTEIEVLAR